MAKIQLTIDPAYSKSWEYWEGMREIIANAKDADEYDGYKMRVEHLPRSNRLVVANEGVTIDPSTLLLLGKSTKGGETQRGRFGEGFVVGILALVRAGHAVRIENGDEAWTPAIERAEDGPFAGQELLVFTTRKLQNHRPDFTIEVENVTKEVWEATKVRFLFLAPPAANDVVELSDDSVLLSEDHKGKIFCRGIFVAAVKDLECGYDIRYLQLDRDRKVVEEWDLRCRLGDIWRKAHDTAPDKFAPRIYDMVKRNSAEVKNLQYYADEKLIKALRSEFEKEHGTATVPVGTMQESRELEQLGAKTAVVDKTLKELLEKNGETVSVVKTKLQGTVAKRYAWNELTAEEQRAAVQWVERVTQTKTPYEIVDFNDATTTVRWQGDRDIVAISRAFLAAEPRELVRSVATHVGTHRGVSVDQVLLDVIFAGP